MMDYGPDNAPNYPPSQQQPAPQPMSQPSQQSPQQKTCVLAILSLVFAFLLPLLGLILGIMALVKIKKDSMLKGKGLAIAGIIVSIVNMVLFFLLFLLFIGGMAYFGVMSPDTMMPQRCMLIPGFSCTDYKVSSGGNLQLSITNNLGTDISTVTLSVENDCEPKAVSWANGETKSFTCKVASGAKGETYKGDISIKYLQAGGQFEQTAPGSLYARYE